MKITGWAIELKGYNMLIMKRIQSGRTGIISSLVGFLLGVGAGFLLWQSPGYLLPEKPAQLPEPQVLANLTPDPITITLTEFESMIRQARAATDSGQHSTAIELLMQADLWASSMQEIDEAAVLLNEAVNSRVLQLRESQQVVEIDKVYESLTLAMPERAEFSIRLAEHRINMGNGRGALPVLAQIENHDQWGPRARELIAGISAPEPELLLASVPLMRSGNQFVVSATIDGLWEISLLIDTGASVSIVAPSVLEGLGYDLAAQAGRFLTANGEVEAPLVGIESLAIGEQQVSPITVGAIGLDGRSEPVDGLLGMNYLQQFEFSLDQQNSVLELYRRTDGPGAL